MPPGMMPPGGLPPGMPRGQGQGNMFGILDPRMGQRGDLTFQQLNQICTSIRTASRAFGIEDIKGFAKMNCGFISAFYKDATCEQIQHVMQYCESYFKDPEHRG
ncbi:unnamed protein product, partial [Mesorhabditis spiculigera]